MSNQNIKLALERQDKKENTIDIINKSLDIKNSIKDKLIVYIFQNKLFRRKLLLYLREVKFNN